MQNDILATLENKIEHAAELIHQQREQISQLQSENQSLKQEQAEWRNELSNLLKKLDGIDTPATEVAEVDAVEVVAEFKVESLDTEEAFA